MDTYTRWKAQRRAQGPQWQCYECNLRFPAAGFGVDWHDRKELHTACIGLGFWKCCIACKERRLQPQLQDASETNSRLCHRCRQQRCHSYSAKDSDVCAACKLHMSFAIAACTVCGKSKNVSEMQKKTPATRKSTFALHASQRSGTSNVLYAMRRNHTQNFER